MLRFRILILLLFITFGISIAGSMQNYCQLPTYMSTQVSPNVLIIVDKSGSMSWAAYYKTWSNSNKVSEIGSYNSNTTYEGYFVPNKVYEKVNGVWQETTKSENCNLTLNSNYYWYYRQYYNYYSISGTCSGNKLNFALMARIDLLRWAMTGGRPQGCSNFTDQNCDPDLACTGTTCTLELDNKKLVQVPKDRVKGVIQSLEEKKTKPRLGVMFFDTTPYSDKVYIGDYPNGENADKDHPYTYTKRAINYVSPSGDTGTGPAMWEAYDYFKQLNEHNITNGFDIQSGTYKDPIYVCDYQGQNCKPAPCAKNFVILLSDGQWNTGINGNTSCSIEDGYENNSTDPVVPAYWMHKKLGRTYGNYNIYVDSVYTVGLFLGGTGEKSLKNVAMYGSFDPSKDWPDNLSGYSQNTCGPVDDCCTGSNCGKGSACTDLPASSPDWDKDGNGIPDTFYSANNAQEMKDSLSSAFESILNKVSSSSTVGVLTGGKGDNGALVEQVVFYPEKYFGNNYKVKWISKLITLWDYKSSLASNIREDTNSNFKLDLTGDKAISYDLDNNGNLVIKKCSVYADGSTNTSDCQTYTGDIGKNNINYLIDVGEKLKDRSYSDRKIYSIDENGNFKLFTSSNASSFDTLLGTNTSEFPSCLKDTNGNIKYGDLIDYILGKQIYGCRNRKVDDNGNTWKLADIMNSSPQIVHYDNYDVVYVASNDGILHAFKLGKYESLNQTDQVAQLTGDNIGKELWGFIPKNALPYLRYLADPNYCHIYLNDLTPYIFNSISGKKILIGGFRLGGGCGYNCSGDQSSCSNPVNPPSDTCTSSSCVGLSSYYALDITDPENPKFLWEFTYKDLGFAYSGPGLIRTKENGVDKEYIIFASGMHNYSAQFANGANNETDRELKIYVLDSNTGQLERTIYTGIQKAFSGRIFSEGLDFDGDGYTDYIAFGYTQQSGSNTSFKGGIILLGGKKINNNLYPFKNASSVSDWSFNNYTSFKIDDKNTVDINPVTTKVEFMKCFDRWYIYFGTGRWFKKDDDWEVNRNTLFGVPFDIKSDNNGQYIDFITTTQNVTDESNVSNICTSSSSIGWYINLDPADSNTYSLKEKNLSDPVVTTQNLIIFTTTKPNGDLCGFGGNTRVWTLNCATGGLPSGCRGDLYQVSNVAGTLLLQLSGSNIQEINIANIADTGRVSNWYKGTPPEGASPFIQYGNRRGEIILWIEK
ncbi:PilC/PilY family type IV pilus protein [Venenivibrio stagnispumantis]|uniref:Type IV pilus assembly protein PilY1 n=1 Tax=Venenivibrio stagnispumantis TaxID=407998 RepID=A0AA46AE19_9AQUI|nr:PilC/PilY family type IV pilus protein [Venenivibrio stagnispumantis]MCW4573343.1 PilC/PilY family type IV pilus protein [Venenivibrio stagnispumantis]SMP10590.1 type IV pilus assembly protein PilY1 [Venenivibrio stagnispumantis]